MVFLVDEFINYVEWRMANGMTIEILREILVCVGR
jgi:hypothetical protein